MPLPHSPSRARLALVGAGTALLLMLSGCATDSPSEAAAAAAAKPLSQAAFITRQLTLSSTDFGEYLDRQAQRLSAGTAEFAAAYESGDDELARALYAPTRSFYNRMLVGAGTFPELDAALDAALDSALDESSGDGPGASSGWHAVERDLFRTDGIVTDTATRQERGQRLVADTETLATTAATLRPTVEQQALGLSVLMSGRATAAAAGTQEPFSHTDLTDLQGYVDGAREAFSGLRPILVTQNAALATTLDHRFEAVEDQLNGLRTGVTFPGYDTLDDARRAALQAAVADLTESVGIIPDTMTQP